MFDYVISTIKSGAKKSYCSQNYIPTDAIIFLTYRCTSRCKACNIWQRPVNIEEELTWEDWEPILANLVKNNIESIELFGGDALLRKDLLIKMIKYCSEHGVKTYFPTNSSSLKKETVEDLVNAGLDTIYFSLDEIPDIGESVRGIKRHFERTLKSIELFQDARKNSSNLKISCITTVSSLNYRYLETLIDFSFNAGVDEHLLRGISEFTTNAIETSEVNGILPQPYFVPTDDKSHAFSIKQADELVKILTNIKKSKSKYSPMRIDMENMRDLKATDFVNLTYPKQTCLFATTQVVISPYGNVLPCLYYNKYHLGNIRNQDLSEIWGNREHKIFCQTQRKGDIPLCDHCSIKYYHRPLLPSFKVLVQDAIEKIGTSVTNH